MNNYDITQKELQELFDYREDGSLVWKVSKAKRIKVGDVAGSLHKSNQRWYIKINEKRMFRSRLVYLFHHGWIPECVDHINGIRDDDRIENLRAATLSQNAKNRKAMKGGTSKYLGVYWSKRGQCWAAAIKVSHKQITLGTYQSEICAAKAYDEAARLFHGEFANPNFPDESPIGYVNNLQLEFNFENEHI